MAKSDKALDTLKKLYGEQAALNKKILAAEKAYGAELKAEAKTATKQTKTVKPAKRGPAKKTGTVKATVSTRRKTAARSTKV
ncbi:MAG: hypothetical protein LBK63_06270 [Treponema sp.]|nr:hypothetical protein [Treponema sp.]